VIPNRIRSYGVELVECLNNLDRTSRATPTEAVTAEPSLLFRNFVSLAKIENVKKTGKKSSFYLEYGRTKKKGNNAGKANQTSCHHLEEIVNNYEKN